MQLEIKRATVAPNVLHAYAALMSQCFPSTKKYTTNYLKWLYQDNPAGTVVGFDAWDGNALAAHYACIPVKGYIDGSPVKTLLSLNTATHPKYQGKGLFVNLAERTYLTAEAEYFDCVYGVANASSTPGFERKLGFQFVESLQAKIGFGSINPQFETDKLIQFKRAWDSASIAWRCANPANPIRKYHINKKIEFYSPAIGNIIHAYDEKQVDESICVDFDSRKQIKIGRLFLGLSPLKTLDFTKYIEIPQYLRPSPLNLIFRSLSNPQDKLEKGAIQLSYLDFDAY